MRVKEWMDWWIWWLKKQKDWLTCRRLMMVWWFDGLMDWIKFIIQGDSSRSRRRRRRFDGSHLQWFLNNQNLDWLKSEVEETWSLTRLQNPTLSSQIQKLFIFMALCAYVYRPNHQIQLNLTKFNFISDIIHTYHCTVTVSDYAYCTL